jgi:copper chaperone
MSGSRPLTTAVFKVIGVSCGWCASSVFAPVGDLPRVRNVRVDLASGDTVISDGPVADSAVRAAVESAGYTMAPA